MGIRVRSGLPLSSSRAWAATPIARKKAPASRAANGRSPRERATRRSRRRTGARACTADAGGSSSPASLRARGRRRPPVLALAQLTHRAGGWSSPPMSRRRPVRQEPGPDPAHAGVLPPPHLGGKREATIGSRTRRVRGTGRSAAIRGRPPSRWPASRLGCATTSRRAPTPARNVELERRHHAPGRRTLASSTIVAAGSATYRSRYVNVTASNVASGNGSSSARPAHETHTIPRAPPLGPPRPRGAPSHGSGRAPRRAGSCARAHAPRDRFRSPRRAPMSGDRVHPRDEEPSPTRILPEREDGSHPVVLGRDAREQLSGEP